LQELVVSEIGSGTEIYINHIPVVLDELRFASTIHPVVDVFACHFQSERRLKSHFTFPRTCFEGKEDDDTICPSQTERSGSYLYTIPV
jgi:hypothetical protein